MGSQLNFFADKNNFDCNARMWHQGSDNVFSI